MGERVVWGSRERGGGSREIVRAERGEGETGR